MTSGLCDAEHLGKSGEGIVTENLSSSRDSVGPHTGAYRLHLYIGSFDTWSLFRELHPQLSMSFVCSVMRPVPAGEC